MADRTEIEWTDATWNPIRFRNRETGKVGWFCEHVTEACRFCYAEAFNRRLGNGLEFKPGNLEKLELFLDENMLRLPLKWKRPRKIFVCSMTDLFGRFITDEMRDIMFGVMAATPWHTYQVLTKRPGEMRPYVERPIFGREVEIFDWPPPNVLFGTSIANQEDANKFVPELLATPAAKRFLSCEPLLGPIHLGYLGWPGGKTCPRDGHNALIGARYENGQMVERLPKIDWVICGGESGPNARPMDPTWARGLRDQCAAADIAFFFKQWGEWAPVGAQGIDHLPSDADFVTRVGKRAAGRLLDGVEHNAFPVAA